MEPNTQKPAKRWLVPALLAVVIVLLIAVIVFMMKPGGQPADTADDSGTPKIGYEEGVTVVEDPDALQKAVRDMLDEAADSNVALEYKNDAQSSDGENFSCYIANSLDNKYDMYVQIFADQELTEQILLTGLIRPGNALDTITLDHPLDSGTHRVYVAFTQVEEDLETIHAQVMVTMDFTVE